ncbi:MULTISPECIES: hypothetical protein [Streptomyces]|nr:MULTISPECIES: hypothetical protein [Streptomyces]
MSTAATTDLLQLRDRGFFVEDDGARWVPDLDGPEPDGAVRGRDGGGA